MEHVLNANKNCKVITIIEHWKSYEQLKSYKINNFKLIASYCRSAGSHGGVAVYCFESVWFKIRQDINEFAEIYTFECAAIEIKIRNKKVIIVALYRTPDTQVELFLTKLNELLSMLIDKNENFIIAGDFNIDLKTDNQKKQKFTSLLESYNVSIAINEFTRITRSSKTCLDNFLTNVNLTYTAKVIETNISDHTAQTLIIKTHSDKVDYKQVRFFTDQNLESFLTYISDEEWVDIKTCNLKDVNQQFNVFVNRFLFHFKEAFPIKKVKETPKKPFVPNSLSIINSRKKLSSLAVLLRFDRRYKILYDIEKAHLNDLITNEKREYCKQKITQSTNISKEIWSMAGRFSEGVRKSKSNKIHIEGNPQQIVNDANYFFVNVGSKNKLCNNFPKYRTTEKVPVATNFMNFELVTEEEITGIIREFKNTYSAGDDEISISLIKKCTNIVTAPLTYIINNSLTYGVFPDRLKLALVTAVYKDGDSQCIENYRPLSILSTFGKVIERVVYNQILNYLNGHNYFCPNQHGFLKNKSADTAIFDYTNAIFEALEGNKLPLGIFLDFSKAYDYIDHKLLKRKLEWYGIEGVPLKWISSYLHNRTQYVKMNIDGTTVKSSILTTTMGVPQGSVLGPLLFNVFIIDLCKLFYSTPHTHVNYADDNSLLVVAEDIKRLEDESSVVLSEINRWAVTNGQMLNVQKTKYILFKTNRSIAEHQLICINNIPTMLSKNIKLLGLNFDDELNWRANIELLTKKLNSISYCIKVLKVYCDESVLRTIYYGSFIAKLKFGIIFWGSSSDATRIFVIQKQVFRIINNIPFRETCRGKFRQMKFLTTPGIYIYECLMFIFKNKQKYVHLQQDHSYGTRSIVVYNYPQHRLSMYEKSLLYSSVKFFNKLPRKIQAIVNLKIFKREIYNLLVEIEPYSITEFLER